ncbi:MAG: M1 family metallopeptidase [Cytophagales bacterium]|nr:M1 family metallopeptidase [Cytophagales bacterium]
MPHILNKSLIFLTLISCSTALKAQPFSRADSLRGSITEERAWWDLTYYHLELEVFPEEQRIEGSNLITYKVLKSHNVLQFDLQRPLTVTKVLQNGLELDFRQDGNAYFVSLIDAQVSGEIQEVQVFYEGSPRKAVRAPWDGGFSWKQDDLGNHFIATSCQGLGASVWWPCKDHMYDEVDSMRLSVEVPQNLVDVSNGRLEKVDRNKKKKTKTFHWFISNPINNYGVNLNIGNYISWKEVYEGEKGPLDITYWALKQDEQKARDQFLEVPRMLKAFEHWFGPYPFYEDGYQLVQAPYLGMEHQSSVTYGNRFDNGYLGRDLSGTGWGLKFDFIIVHESGHEWFANNITHQDIADMWIHESFTNYSESLFVEYHFGKEAGQEYVRGTRTNIENSKPMIGNYGVNDEGYPIDVYYKGGNILNMLRSIVKDDAKWRDLLRALGIEFYHSTTNSAEFEQFIAQFLGLDLSLFFNQYLRDSRIPIFEYYFKEGNLYYRWTNTIADFTMPVDVVLGDAEVRLSVSNSWANMEIDANSLRVNPNYYIGILKSR